MTSAQPRPAVPHVLGVLGASGGVGASTLAAGCAVRAVTAGVTTVLLDPPDPPGRLDLLLGCEQEPGLRWSDLLRAPPPTGAETWLRLPRGAGLPVLTSGMERQPREARLEAAGARAASIAEPLVGEMELAVLDLGRCWRPGDPWVDRCDTIVLVAGTGVTQAVAAVMLAFRLPSLQAMLTRTGGPVPPRRLQAQVGVPLLARFQDDPAIARALALGDPVGAEAGPLTSAADAVLAMTLRRELPEDVA